VIFATNSKIRKIGLSHCSSSIVWKESLKNDLQETSFEWVVASPATQSSPHTQIKEWKTNKFNHLFQQRGSALSRVSHTTQILDFA